MLTPRQELYVSNLYQGMSQAKAYISAGYANNDNIKIVTANAYRLANKEYIKDRLQSLYDAKESVLQLDISGRKQRLSELATENIINEKNIPLRTSNIQAIAELNRMDQLTDKQPLTINYQAILTRAEEIEKDFIEGKYAIIESQEPRKNEG